MANQFSDTLRNAMLDAYETTIGGSAVLQIRSGPPPADTDTADSGTLLVSCSLPADPMAAAASGSKAKSGTWEDTSADATGRGAHFRIKDGSAGVHHQGIAAMAWAASYAYALGDYAINDSGKLYTCSTAGTSAGSGGPTGTGSGITDGTAEWDYVQAQADMVLDNAEIAAGQQFTQTSWTLTAGNA